MASKRNRLQRTRAAVAARLATPPEQPNVSLFTLPGPNGLRIRAAEAVDLADFRRLCATAGVDIEDEIAAAIETGSAGEAVYTGLTSGIGAFFDDIMTRLDSMSVPALRELFLRLTVALVAESDDTGVTGAALAFPPVGIIMNQLKQLRSLGASDETRVQLTLAGALRVSRIKAVAVRDDARRSGVGSALVQACNSAFSQLGYSSIYGIMPPSIGLRMFYSGLGFTILPPGQPYTFAAAGLPTAVQADDGEQIFYLHPN
ncbi:GNAT family N-acetyltransferase [Micromonospora marina]|uniref:GNAT family N-acetyltransferase n=1 Tax=Micromonospora marina TaxID=307120 RepID=UPI003D724F81